MRRSNGAIRVLELRSAEGAGGGPEKTILTGAAEADPRRVAVTVGYIRDVRDEHFCIGRRAAELGLDYVEFRQRGWWDRATWGAIARVVVDRGIEIVHAHEYKTDLIALWLARRTGVVPLATVHGWTGSSRRERWLYYPVDKRLLGRFPRLLAVSSEIRRALERVGVPGRRIETLLNGIDHRAFRREGERRHRARAALGLGPEEVAIGAVGRVERQKRFDVLLEAMARLRARRRGLRLLIAGEGSLRAALTAMAGKLGLDGACTFLGHCDNVVDLYHAIDVLVQSSDYEGTPNVVLEAMALEVPLVATEVGGTGELVADGVHGVLVRPGDAVVLADAVERTLVDPGWTRRRVLAARSRVEGALSFEARLRRLERVYVELASGEWGVSARGRGAGWEMRHGQTSLPMARRKEF